MSHPTIVPVENRTPPGFYPNPYGKLEYWYWDGGGWTDFGALIEDQMLARLQPAMESIYREGLRHGAAIADRAVQLVKDSL